MDFAVSLLFPQAFTAERRASPRYRVSKAAILKLPDDSRQLSANIVNMSAGGAALEVAATAALPAAFELVIAAEGLSFHAKVRWRRGALVGVQFEGEAQRLGR
jgi:hypothetical protein